MHYIIGTNFTVNPNPSKSGVRDKRFKPGNSYSLLHISKKQDKALYTFIGADRSRFDVEFNSCRDADMFISRIRNENIPNYDVSSSVIDTVTDD
jgi:hypothetical protein